MSDQVKEDTLYAIFSAIRKASADNVEALEQIDRLAHAGECILANMPIDDEGYTRST